ncbi:hypothetical protein GTS_42620 [Gandjariella thermophila]|uniref:Type IV secretion protein Rhs n=1 Tax=Gandjariella thermophila TaxID=1931992 RepID=A0A4D4JE50_9PSEU|nr:hypothetical protein GTS_42620 [Gandjariella thermophila]
MADHLGAQVGERQLGETDDPKELVHGDVGAIDQTAGHLTRFAAAFGETARGLAAIDTAHWDGQAAEAFRAKYQPHPKQWADAEEACAKAAGAWQNYAHTVTWAQGQAAEAIHLYQQGKRASEQARDTYNRQVDEYNAHVRSYNAAVSAGQNPGPQPQHPGTFTDPGVADMRQARQILADARQILADARRQRDSAAEQARQTMAAATSLAPLEPSFSQRMLDDAADLWQGGMVEQEHLLGGVAKGVGGIAKFARSLNPLDPYNLTHPAAFVDGLSTTAAGLLHATSHPTELVKGLVGTGWSTDPAEAFGKLLPNIALAAVTDGAGSAADAGASVAERSAMGAAEEAAERGAVGAGESAAEDGAANAGRAEARPEDPREPARDDAAKTECGDPVDVATGAVVLRQTDVELPGLLPLVLRRTHLSSYRQGGWFGRTWASTLDERVEVDAEGVILVRGDGVLLTYPHPGVGAPVLPAEGARWPLESTDAGGYQVTDSQTGHVRHFTAGRGGVLPLSAITDRLGHRIDIVRDADGAPREVRHSGGYRVWVDTADGRVTALRVAGEPDVEIARFTYTEGQLTGVVNSSGEPLRFRYDHAGRLTEWVDRNGTWYRYTYDAAGRCVRQAGSDGFMAYTFDYGDGVTVATNSLGHATTYHVNEAKQIVREVDPLGNETRCEWDRYDRLLSRTDPLGRTTRFEYDEHGNLVGLTRPDGSRSLAEYNDLGQPVTLIDPDGSVWRQEYDAAGNRVAVTDPAGATTRFGYDEHGHLTSVTDAAGNTRQVVTDAAGLVVAVTEPDGTTTRYRRDSLGRIVEITDPVGGVTRLTWTPEGRLASRTLPDGAAETWSYDGEGNLVEHVDAAGSVTRTEYTHFDLPAARIGPDGSRLTFAYDTDLRLTRVTNPQGLTWEYHYDPAGRLISESDFNGRVVRYGYDAAGQLVRRVNGAGQTVDYGHDPLGRVVRQRADGAVTTFEHDPLGRLVRAVGPDAELVYRRDALGRVLAETVNGRTVTSTYDALGRRVRRVTPSGAESVWAHDVRGNLVALTTAGRSLRFDRDAAGRETRRHLGLAAVLEQTWDANHRLTGQTLSSIGIGPTPGGPDPCGAGTGEPWPVVQQRRYTYRADGYLLGLDDLLGGSRRFDLDRAGRVTAVHGVDWAERYGYDAAGNIVDAAWPTTPAAQPAVGAREYRGTLISRAGNVRYRYDAQGRIVQRQKIRLSRKPETWQYTWDAEDRLVGVVTPDGQRWRYRYDPLGRRIAKQRLGPDGTTVVEQVDFVWDGTTLAEQTAWEPGGARVTTWEHDGLRPVTQTERTWWRDAPQAWVDERFYAIVTDLVGTPSELVDDLGAVAGHARSTLWGTTTWTGDSAGTPLRFPGQYHDPETGLNYNYFRYYDPETARYTTLDPLGLAPSPNPNTYVHNPHTWTDPLGLSPCDVDAALNDWQSKRYQFDNQQFILDKRDMRHILTRHHPDYWDGSTKAQQTFFDKGTSISDVENTISQVLSQNRDTLIQQGSNGMYQIEGVVDGREYVLGINRGHVGQFYPK